MQVLPLLVAALVGLFAAPAAAGTQSFDVTIRNTGETVLACDASIAHWFSNALGDVAPGQTLRFTLLADASDGTVFMRNSAGDEMPVQRLWCGLKGRSWATRAEIGLDRRIGEVPAPIALDCAGKTASTVCARP
ncbi:hypothetical protein ABUE31_14205 [Mesorhizobium sp. ZMM04-5]|uniref:Uncharacterized protein n=1 Tax=Mesorhizobium marinum TaxID=3228790 RepID=A0ABV3R3L5_9HYPH